MAQRFPVRQRLRATERRGVIGAGKSGSLSSLTAANVRLMVSIAADHHPLSNAMLNASSNATTTTAETRGGRKRSNLRSRNRTSLRISWPSSTNANNTTSDSTAVNGWSQNFSRGTPMKSRISSCHTWK